MNTINLLAQNSYHLLGLDVLTDFKILIKRSKELQGMLSIDEHPRYDLDIKHDEKFRTELLIKQAKERISNPQQKIKESFFWFYRNDDIDEAALDYFVAKDFDKAIFVWEEQIKNHPESNVIYKKNLVVLYLILIASENEKKYLQPLMGFLNEILNEKWKQFTAFYKLHDDTNIDDIALEKSKLDIKEWLVDFFTLLSQEYSDQEYLIEFQKIFKLNIGKINSDVILPISKKVHDLISDLKSMDISKDGKFDSEEAYQLKKIIGCVQEELNKVISLNLYTNHQIIELRNQFSSTLRLIALDLHNNLSDIETSQKLLNISKELAESSSLITRIEQDLIVVDEAINEENLLDLPDSMLDFDLVVKRDSISYKGKKIYYKDATGASYYTLRSSTYFIPTNQSYEFNIIDENQEINVKFSSFLMINNDDKIQLFSQLITAVHMFIEHLVIKKLVYQIFSLNEEVIIGNVIFNKDGFHKKKFWGNGLESVLWKDENVYKANMGGGFIHMFKHKQGKSDLFESIPTNTYNSIFIPKLIEECILMVSVNV